jgi:hypothetical protein
MSSRGIWLEPVWAQCLELWKQDLRAMKEGRYTPPLPHINVMDGWDAKHLSAVRGWKNRRRDKL